MKLDLNTLKSLSMQDFLIIYLIRHFKKGDIARGLSVTPSSVTQRLTKISAYIDIDNYEYFMLAARMLGNACDLHEVVKEIQDKIKRRRAKEAPSKQGYLNEDNYSK